MAICISAEAVSRQSTGRFIPGIVYGNCRKSLLQTMIITMRRWRLLILIPASWLLSCAGHPNNPVAIRDFRKSLQPYLTDLVARGIVGFDTSVWYIENQTTDSELSQLSKCEHPVLRAVALRAMLKRNSFDHFDVIMNNLDDTATVATDNGEFGIKYNTVSDDLLENGRWKDTAARRKTIEAVVLHHRRLKAAFGKLYYIKQKPGAYTIIREMALTGQDDEAEDRPLSFTRIRFEERESALYALAAFRKKEDIPLIKQVLLHHAWRMNESSFGLMRDFPDTTYMEVYQSALRTLYKEPADNMIGYRIIAFAKSVAVQKNSQSAAMLQSMLQRKPIVPANVDSSNIRSGLCQAVLDNLCPAYAHLRAAAEAYIKQKEEWEKANIFYLTPAEPYHFVDTAKEPVRWWSR